MSKKAKQARLKDIVRKAPPTKLKNGDKDWNTPCQNCDELPTVHPTELCGPCCFGEAVTHGGNW